MKSPYFDPGHPKYIDPQFGRGKASLARSNAERAYERRNSLGNKRKRRSWSASEERLLLCGVARFGYGQWTDICNHYAFRDRTPIDLKDKARNMKRHNPKCFGDALLQFEEKSISGDDKDAAKIFSAALSHCDDRDDAVWPQATKRQKVDTSSDLYNNESFESDDADPNESDRQTRSTDSEQGSNDSMLYVAKTFRRAAAASVARQTTSRSTSTAFRPISCVQRQQRFGSKPRKSSSIDAIRTDSGGGDVSQRYRTLVFEMAYGTEQRTRCIMCAKNEVHTDLRGYELAHIVPRKWHGNNTAPWNRLATCATCNSLVAQNNLLDVVAERYPERLEQIIDVLWRQFKACEPTVASLLASKGRQYFVRFLYGQPVSSSGGGGVDEPALQIFGDRHLSHWRSGAVAGVAQSPRLHSLLQAIDRRCSRVQQLDSEIESTRNTIAHLQRHLDAKLAERRGILAIKAEQ